MLTEGEKRPKKTRALVFNESKNGGADHYGKVGKEGQEQQLLLPRQNRNGRKRDWKRFVWDGNGKESVSDRWEKEREKEPW